MLNIHELERQWLKYKIKSYLPTVYSILAISTFVILGIIFFPLTNQLNVEQNISTVKPVALKTVPEKVEAPEIVVSEVPQNTQSTKSDTERSLVLRPSLSFMDNIENTLDPYANDIITEQETNANTLTSTEPEVESKQTQKVEVIEVRPTVKKKSNALQITRNQSDSDLKDVIRRFKKNKNPALSLFIAKRYYALGKYQKSYNYALMTNEIDKSIDESWIIFSKSLVKLGQHELAMVTLKSYLKTNKSTAAQVLLGKIESGEFR